MEIAMSYHVDSHEANDVAAATQGADMAEVPFVPQGIHPRLHEQPFDPLRSRCIIAHNSAVVQCCIAPGKLLDLEQVQANKFLGWVAYQLWDKQDAGEPGPTQQVPFQVVPATS